MLTIDHELEIALEALAKQEHCNGQVKTDTFREKPVFLIQTEQETHNPALHCPNVGNIGCPDFIGLLWLKLPIQQIVANGQIMAAIGGIFVAQFLFYRNF